MGTTTALRQRLRATLEARCLVYDGRGSPQCMNFRRTVGEDVHLLALNWEKSGKPRFFGMFGKATIRGVTYHGAAVRGDELLIEHSPTIGFLAPKDHRFDKGWFRQDPSYFQRLLNPRFRGAESVEQHFLALLEEVERYWSKGTIGPHIKLAENPRPWVTNPITAQPVREANASHPG